MADLGSAGRGGCHFQGDLEGLHERARMRKEPPGIPLWSTVAVLLAPGAVPVVGICGW